MKSLAIKMLGGFLAVVFIGLISSAITLYSVKEDMEKIDKRNLNTVPLILQTSEIAIMRLPAPPVTGGIS